ncbi:hypothetical protein [Cohnella sp. AR92]|uniref:hypothetical protein n=1 Tax=Cohnella sp. AR92 TaxID=648716 RepID=UPI000F8D87A2|nr:hypothetical protein [Cohnella sp. AR92]RUS47951.1 hypothetical protein ELR57_05290 [Cohnella sp. AR92]
MSLPARSRLSVREQAARTADAPVLVTLTDGRQYVGRIQRICNGQLYLAGMEVQSKPKKRQRSAAKSSAKSSRRQARTSAFLVPQLQTGVDEATAGTVQAEQALASAQQGGGFGFGGLGGLKDWMGFMEKALPMIKMGMGVIKSIMPLLGALKI